MQCKGLVLTLMRCKGQNSCMFLNLEIAQKPFQKMLTVLKAAIKSLKKNQCPA